MWIFFKLAERIDGSILKYVLFKFLSLKMYEIQLIIAAGAKMGI